MKKIWIDTDIGDDIDDALAFLLAMSNSEIEIVGVSTVFENTEARAKIASFLLEKGGLHNVPVYVGIGSPIKATSVFNDVVNVNKFPKTYISEKFEKSAISHKNAIDAIKDAAIANDGLTIVSIGALSNVAAFIEKYPMEAKKTQLVMMGAAKGLNLNEFNITCDPESAAKVFSSSIPKKIITLDCTFRCEVSEDKIKRLKALNSEVVSTVMDMYGKWGGKMILHDPLALSVALGKDFVTFEKGDLFVETEGKYSRGKCVDMTDFNWAKKGREDMLVSVDVDAEAFVEYFVTSIENLNGKFC